MIKTRWYHSGAVHVLSVLLVRDLQKQKLQFPSRKKREQEVIERPVDVDLEAKRVTVRIPYIVDTVKSLTKKHRDNNNLKQAKVVYISQCRKPEDMKSAMQIAHVELVSREFMIRLTDLGVDYQQFIMNAMSHHFDH